MATDFRKSAPAETAQLKETVSGSMHMDYVLTSLYDQSNYKVPNYYIVLSDNADARYDNNTGSIIAPAGAHTLILDLYNYTADEEITLPAGTYTMIEGTAERPFGYTYEYTMLNEYNENGEQNSVQLTAPVEVTKMDNGQYHISTTCIFSNKSVNVSYDGPLTFGSSTEKPTVYPQINHNITANLDKGGVSFYQGVTDLSSQGVSYINLYDVDFDETNG